MFRRQPPVLPTADVTPRRQEDSGGNRAAPAREASARPPSTSASRPLSRSRTCACVAARSVRSPTVPWSSVARAHGGPWERRAGAGAAAGWSGGCSCAQVPAPPGAPPGHETGWAGGLQAARAPAAGEPVAPPCPSRQTKQQQQQPPPPPPLATAPRRVGRRTTGRKRRTQASTVLA